MGAACAHQNKSKLIIAKYKINVKHDIREHAADRCMHTYMDSVRSILVHIDLSHRYSPAILHENGAHALVLAVI